MEELFILTSFRLDDDRIKWNGSPAWASQGRKLACVVRMDEGAQFATAIIDPENDTIKILHPYTPPNGDGGPSAPHWNPDGNSIAIVIESSDSFQTGLWILPVNGKQEIPVYGRQENGNRVDFINVYWRLDGLGLVFSNSTYDDYNNRIIEYWFAIDGDWEPISIELPPGAYLVGWRELIE